MVKYAKLLTGGVLNDHLALLHHWVCTVDVTKSTVLPSRKRKAGLFFGHYRITLPDERGMCVNLPRLITWTVTTRNPQTVDCVAPSQNYTTHTIFSASAIATVIGEFQTLKARTSMNDLQTFLQVVQCFQCLRHNTATFFETSSSPRDTRQKCSLYNVSNTSKSHYKYQYPYSTLHLLIKVRYWQKYFEVV